jgi:hypothetical protein
MGVVGHCALAVLLAFLLLAGCGDDDGGGGSGGTAVGGGPTLDNPIELADCTDWKEGSVEERLGTIRQITDFIDSSVPGTGGTGVTLDDDEAYDLFERACSNDFARGFNLYKIYVRAAGFSSLQE